MKVAVEGCCHGALDAIYQQIKSLQDRNNYKVELLLICGDFQAVRNHRDLQCMAVPPKYRQLGDFYKYYTGEKVAPLLTIVIGGNHEASSYFWELYHGGWLAPNIYFLGHAGCIQVNGVRIAGASGIFKNHDFHQGHHERMPYDHGSMRSIYHVREYNIRRLSLLSKPDIFLSHDWPQSIEKYGDTRGLLRKKPFFRQDIDSGNLGSPPLMGLLQTLRPDWWFSAHLHVRFEAVVKHGSGEQGPGEGNPSVVRANPEEIVISDEDFDEGNTATEAALTSDVRPTMPQNPDEIALISDDEFAEPMPRPVIPQCETKFIALDKCLPRRDFLEIVEIQIPHSTGVLAGQTSPLLTYDPEWLAVTRAFHQYFTTSRQQATYPDEPTARARVSAELQWVEENIVHKAPNEDVKSPLCVDNCQVFVQTAPGPGSEDNAKFQQPPWYTNPQTVSFCSMLGIDNKINPSPST
ncbi:lariat debranching enzyme [Butyriboletus roseoflavus]|nr:lariat debranching enzyme [Butyriboletus roseoflavus]